MQEQKEIGESIRRYKNKLDLENKLSTKEITPTDLLKHDIEEGKYPELTERMDDLHHLYHMQKMRDLKKAQQEKVKSLSKLHL